MNGWPQALPAAVSAQTLWDPSRGVEVQPPEAGWRGMDWTRQCEPLPEYTAETSDGTDISATGYAPQDALFTAHLMADGGHGACARASAARERHRPAWSQREQAPDARYFDDAGPPPQLWMEGAPHTARPGPTPMPGAHAGSAPAGLAGTSAATHPLPPQQGARSDRPPRGHSLWTTPDQDEPGPASPPGGYAKCDMAATQSEEQPPTAPLRARAVPHESSGGSHEPHGQTGSLPWSWPNTEAHQKWHGSAEAPTLPALLVRDRRPALQQDGQHCAEPRAVGIYEQDLRPVGHASARDEDHRRVGADAQTVNRAAESAPPTARRRRRAAKASTDSYSFMCLGGCGQAFLRDVSRRTHWRVYRHCAEKHDEAMKAMLDEPTYRAVSTRSDEGNGPRRRYMYSTRMYPAMPQP
ncbi:hypothetical protein AURDEDRAFT_166925 [Auricularia subglabra TFB-10046 SS5]|nr:hypothetical protein AURDEDRAFT_166925 [Auricularia subglabra TFB-10046 SS5]